MYMEVTRCHLTSRLHHLVELGLNVKLRVLGLDALQLDCHLDSCLDIGACGCGRCVGAGGVWVWEVCGCGRCVGVGGVWVWKVCGCGEEGRGGGNERDHWYKTLSM